MTRKEIIFLSGKQILLIMAIVGNALVVGFMWRYHAYKIFVQEKRDLSQFTLAQRNERTIKEEILILEGKKYWTETAYAKKNAWSVLPNERQ